jgi:Acyltransferase
MSPLARELAQISAREMVTALGAARAPELLKRGLSLPLAFASRRLGETLAALEEELPRLGLPAAAKRALRRFGTSVVVTGAAVGAGPTLILANHPGAYDALCLMRAIKRRDLRILAADRVFLRALPGLSSHLTFVGEGKAERAAALKRALVWLRAGGALLHFPAGCIEPDADFSLTGELLAPWQAGVAALVKACQRASGRVLVAGVRGVHSPRAKRLRLNRLAESQGVTTLSPLVQLVLGLRDVRARVHLEAGPAELFDLAPTAQEQALRRALLSALAAG